jgi:hypothetical protein
VLTRDEWRLLIDAAKGERPAPIAMTTFLEKLPDTASRPIKVLAGDGRVYIVKGRQSGKMVVNEQIVAVLAEALNAPVPTVCLIDIPETLINAEPGMAHIVNGVSLAGRWVDGCTDRLGLEHVDLAENRDRFARLCLLYSWVGASDHQWIYEKAMPNRVYSVDHGHFFPNGPDWTSSHLMAAAFPVPDPQFLPCAFRPEEFDEPIAALRSVGYDGIARAVARPPDDWAIIDDERIDLAVYLESRRALLAGVLSCS